MQNSNAACWVRIWWNTNAHLRRLRCQIFSCLIPRNMRHGCNSTSSYCSYKKMQYHCAFFLGCNQKAECWVKCWGLTCPSKGDYYWTACCIWTWVSVHTTQDWHILLHKLFFFFANTGSHNRKFGWSADTTNSALQTFKKKSLNGSFCFWNLFWHHNFVQKECKTTFTKKVQSTEFRSKATLRSACCILLRTQRLSSGLGTFTYWTMIPWLWLLSWSIPTSLFLGSGQWVTR